MKIFGDQQNFCNVSNQGWIKHFNSQTKPIKFIRGGRGSCKMLGNHLHSPKTLGKG